MAESANIDQWQNGAVAQGDAITADDEWTNGNVNHTKAHYSEGESVPYRIVFEDLVPGETYTITIVYDTTKGGDHAFDYLTSYNQTLPGAPATETDPDPTLGTTLEGDPVESTIAIPVDSNVTAGQDGIPGNSDDIVQESGSFSMWGGDLTGASAYTRTGTYAGDSSTSITITFEATSDTAILAWGGHIASEDDWGVGNSASAISGSPYHMSFTSDDFPGGSELQLAASAVVNLDYSIQKTVLDVDGDTSSPVVDSAGDVITYSIVVKNEGDGNLTGVDVSDALLEGTNGTLSGPVESLNTNGILEVGETWTYTGTYTVQQSDLDSNGGGDGDIDNTATLSSNELDDETSSATVPVVQSKTLDIDKSASVSDGTADSTSDVITYSYTLTNTGNAAISGIVLTDDNGTPSDTNDDFAPLFDTDGDADSDGALDVGETWLYSATRAVTQEMLDAGDDIVNIVTADSPDTDPATDDETVEVVQSKTLDIDKSASVSDGTADSTSDVITYSYTLTNTGNAAISGIVLTDDNGTPSDTNDDFAPLFDTDGDADSDGALDVGETWLYSATRAVTQEMLDAGDDIVNIVTADSPDTDPATDDETVEVVQSKTLDIDKSASVSDGTADSTSDVITYSYTLTNTGNAAISGIVLTDDNGTPSDTNDDFAPLFDTDGDADSDGALDVGETWLYSATRAVTQEMLDAGDDIVNIVTADSPDTDPATDDETVEVVQSKLLSIEKNADVTGGTADVTTDVITYSYTLTNAGNTAISGIVLTDDNGTPSDTNDDFAPLFDTDGDADSDGALDVGETWLYSATRAVTQEMLDAGDDIVNIVTADDGEDGAPPATDDATVDVVKPEGELDITKVVVNIVSKGKHADKVGDVVTYKIVVDNTGDTPLTGVVVTDTIEGHGPVILDSSNSTKTGDVGNDGILGVNETWTYTYNYSLTADDLFQLADDNRMYNTATVDTDQTLPENATAAVDLGPGVKAYGFWALSSVRKFWDGIANNETLSQKISDSFPMGDITRPPYANPEDNSGADQAGMVLDPVTGTYKFGLLVGDWNLNGQTDAGEQTLFFTTAEAVAILTASASTVSADARYLLARELLGSWLNYQSGNPVLDLNELLVGDALDAQDVINWAIEWLQARTPNEGDTADGDGSLTFQSAAWKILTSSPFWTTGIDGGDAGEIVDGVSPVPFFDDPANDGDVPAGATLRSYLSEYNNDGTILGVHIAIE